jgi:hypothetical protein
MYNFLTIGYDCSPAATLRTLNLREFALPFDWVISSITSIQKCFEDNFIKFHTNLKFNDKKQKLIDSYGFEFPHDYPRNNKDKDQNITTKVISFLSTHQKKNLLINISKIVIQKQMTFGTNLKFGKNILMM